MTNRERILAALKRGTLLFDGATGTYAASLPGFPQEPVELACLSAPEQVLALHRAYLDAGAQMIKTNTFAAHPDLAAADEGMQRQVIHAACVLAKEAANPCGALVFADIGPAPAGEEPAKAYIRMADAFLDEGADCFLFETLSGAQGIEEAAAYIRMRCANAYIAVSFASGPDGYTRTGEPVRELISMMDGCASVDAVGLNCACGAYHMRRLIGQLGSVKKTLIAMPNAGYPHVEGGRVYYDSDPAYFAREVSSCAALGAGIIGGCCGTTPAHIAMIARMSGAAEGGLSKEKQTGQKAESICQSGILRALQEGKKPVLVEIDPPKSAQIAGFIDGARRLTAHGVHAITIADCPIGRASMDASLLACKLKREYGVETMPHMTCRDRNINATKALLLGLSMEGVHNVLAVTGDPVQSSDRENVKGVFQFHSRALARFVSSLCRSSEAEPFFLCAALNVNAVNFDAELSKAKEKEACGVAAFLTQPVLSERAAVNLHKARQELKGYLFGGLFPIVSQRNALFMGSEVAGVELDKRIAEAFKGLDRAQGEMLAIRLCMDVTRRIDGDVDGYYVMTPFQRFDLVCALIDTLREEGFIK